VHSHVRRALAAGVKPEEIYHTLLLLVSTIGFPQSRPRSPGARGDRQEVLAVTAPLPAGRQRVGKVAVV